MSIAVSRCRRVLGLGSEVTDEEVRSIRDELYELAEVGLDLVIQTGRTLHTQSVCKAGRVLNDKAMQELFDERAGIMEHEGGVPREKAERCALEDVLPGRTN